MNKLWRVAFNTRMDLLKEALEKLREWRRYMIEVDRIKSERLAKKNQLIQELIKSMLDKKNLAFKEL